MVLYATCVICGGDFEDGPHVPCDCGREIGARDLREISPDRIDEMRAAWAAKLAGAAGTAAGPMEA